MTREDRLHIVLISSWFPYPPDNGSRLRAYNLLKLLAARYTVSLLSFTSPEFKPEHVDAVRSMCQSVQTTPQIPFRPGGMRALAAFLSPKPRFLVDVYSTEMQDLVDRELAKHGTDVLVASELAATPYVRAGSRAAKVFDDLEVAVYYDAFARAEGATRLRNMLTWQKLSHYLRARSRVFDAMTVVSQGEHDLLRRMGVPEERLFSLPNGVEFDACADIRPPKEPNSLIYSGALTYGANRDAAYYFVREIMPEVKRHVPSVQLRITGQADQVAINELSVDNAVLFTGYVPDVRPLVAASKVCIVPLRLGSGTRLKILEAMALGTPVVSTLKGIEGLDFTPDRDVLIADTPAEFAHQVVRLLQDSALSEQIARNARARVQEQYDWKILGAQLYGLVEQVAKRNRNGNA